MLQDQYTKQTPLALIIIEYVNVAVTLTFLLLFVRRFHQLRGHSDTFKYKKYFPKLRLVLCILFTLLSAALLIHNITTDSYQVAVWYEYLLQGGGGQCVNAIILMLQLGVLRFELNKEQPYSPYHFAYFIYLTILEIVRFTFTLMDTLNQQNDNATLILCSLILAVGLTQLIYWKIKRKSLPQFVDPTQLEIDDLNIHVRHIQITNERIERSTFSKSSKTFPFLMPFVCYQNGKFKIVFERVQHEKESDKRSTKTSDREKKLEEVEDSLLTNSPYREEEHEVVAAVYYTVEQIKKLYAICGRFPIKKELQINFQNTTLSELVHSVHRLLSDILSDQNHYDSELLLYLELPVAVRRDYEVLKEKSYLIHRESSEKIDQITGFNIPEDANSTYFSIVGYKSLWVGPHLTFYFKVTTKSKNYISYPFKRIHDIEQFHHYLKRTLKNVGKHLDIPAICKHKEERKYTQEANTLQYLELYLRKICNEYCLMSYEPTAQIILDFLGLPHITHIQPNFQSQFFKDMRVEPKNYCLTLINKQSTPIYEFTLMKNNEPLKIISKDANSLLLFQEVPMTLWQQLTRFIKNNHLTHKIQFALDKRDRKEVTLKKIAKYLQQICQIKHISKLYSAAAFFDTSDCFKRLSWFRNTIKSSENANEERLSSISENSENQQRVKITDSPPTFLSSRFSNIIDDLGNQSLDSP